MSLLSIRGLSKTYGGVAALRDASLEVDAGEVHALMGENGAGKSTLIKILAGAVRADAGEFAVNGLPVSISSTRDAYRLGLRFLHQELNVLPRRSVAENLFLGHSYPTRFAGLIDRRALHERARAALTGLGVTDIAPETTLGRLSTGDQMVVKIASTFVEDASGSGRLFVMDEPTAALSSEEAARLFRIIAELKRRGRAIIYVSHRIDEVLRISDRITVMRDGTSPGCDSDRQSDPGIVDRSHDRPHQPRNGRDRAGSLAAIHRAGRAGNDGQRAHGRILRSPRG